MYTLQSKQCWQVCLRNLQKTAALFHVEQPGFSNSSGVETWADYLRVFEQAAR